MNTCKKLLCLLTLVASMTAGAQTPSTATEPALKIASVDDAGKLLRPADLQTWVFLGASLGMGYNPGSFNAEHPGQFQVVLMEPTAYRYFVENKRYAPGSMFLLSFYDADQHASINKNGYVQADMTNFEIHLVEPRPGEDGHAFYTFGANDAKGNRVPAGNNCVSCHTKHGAFDGTFAQFYPTIRPLIPKDALERARNDRDIR
jgi:hypothetical protein